MKDSCSARQAQRRGGARLAGSLALLGAGHAAADALPAPGATASALSVVMPAGADCLNEHGLRARVESAAGRRVFDDDPASRVAVVFTREGAGWQATLRAQGAAGSGERSLHSAGVRCADLDDGVVLVVSTFVGRAAPGGSDSPEAAPPEPPAPPRPVPDARPEAAPAAPLAATPTRGRSPYPPRPRAPFRWLGWAGGELGTGALPGVAYGVAGGALAERGGFGVRLGALVYPRAVAGLVGAGEAHFLAALGQLEACGHALPEGRLGVALCVGGRAGLLRVRTTGLDVTARPRALFAALELAVRLELRARDGRRSFAQLGAVLPLRSLEYTYDVDDIRTSYHVTLPGIALSAGAIFGPGS